MARRRNRTGAYVEGLSRRQRYEQSRTAMLTERSSFDAHWNELGQYLMPRRTRFMVTDRNKGDRRSSSIIDSAPRFAARTLQSGMHAGLTSPARPWLRLTTHNPELAERPDVKAWLHLVTRRMLDVFHQGNIYNCLPTVYGDIGVFGTAAAAIMEDGEELLRAYPFPLGCYALGVDARGKVSTFVRDYSLNVRQIVGEFAVVDGNPRNVDWSRVSQAVKDAYARGNYEQQVELTWFIEPNDEQDENALEARYAMPFRSCHYERGRNDGAMLRDAGYNEFPIVAPRWDVTAEDSYGTDSPGISTLGDVKQLQLMQRNKAKAIAKAIDPPLKGPVELKNQKVSHLPGDITYVSERQGGGTLTPIHEVNLAGLQYFIQDMNETRVRIQRGFYEDLFLMLAMSDQRQPITAAEVAARHEEKLIALGPVLERTNDELLDPLVDRTFAIMMRAGAIPAPPEALEGVELKVEYTSLLSQAQKLVGIGATERFVSSTLAVAQVFPEVRHKVNAFQYVDDLAEMTGINPALVRSDEEASELYMQEQQAARAAAQAAQLKDVAAAGKTLADTKLEGGNALEAALGMAA